jgi:hypothetical protein
MGRILRYLLLAVVVLGVAFYFYQRNIVAIPVSTADLAAGGAYSDADKTTLKTACAALIKKDTDTVCGCVTDKAGAFSPFERKLITAAFQEKLSDVVALTKGMIASGIPADQMKAAEEAGRKHLTELRTSCKAG